MAKLIGACAVAAVVLSANSALARDKVQTILSMPFASKTAESTADTTAPARRSDAQNRRAREREDRTRAVSPELNQWLKNKHPKPAGR